MKVCREGHIKIVDLLKHKYCYTFGIEGFIFASTSKNFYISRYIYATEHIIIRNVDIYIRLFKSMCLVTDKEFFGWFMKIFGYDLEFIRNYYLFDYACNIDNVMIAEYLIDMGLTKDDIAKGLKTAHHRGLNSIKYMIVHKFDLTEKDIYYLINLQNLSTSLFSLNFK